MPPGLDGRGRTGRQTGRRGRQMLHEFLNAALQLGIMAFQYLHRVLFDGDIRIHSVSLDYPAAVLIRRTELWHKNGATVEQRPVLGDADRSAPRALADERADFPLTERIRENIPVRRGVLVDQRHLRSR